LKGRAITIRTCVERGIGTGIRLTNLKDVTAGENATAPAVPAKRVLYWFHQPGDLKDRVGMTVEINASVNDAMEEELGLTARDVVGEFDAPSAEQPVVNASNAPASGAVGTTGGNEIPESLTLKRSITKVRNLPAGRCG